MATRQVASGNGVWRLALSAFTRSRARLLRALAEVAEAAALPPPAFTEQVRSRFKGL